jgi:hypothetical protein
MEIKRGCPLKRKSCEKRKVPCHYLKFPIVSNEVNFNLIPWPM